MIIYKAENKINDKVYIGKTINGLQKRIKGHLSDALGKHRRRYNSTFHRAIRKYGIDNFEWSVLTETDSENKLNILEKFYIAAYRKMTILYNCTNGGEGSSGIIISEETKQKLKGRIPWNKEKGHLMMGENNPFYGKHHSRESIQKNREAHIGRPSWNKGKTGIYSQETIEKIKKARKDQIITEETRKKISIANKDKIVSEETRKKISETLKGHSVSDNTKLKISKVVQLSYDRRKFKEVKDGL